MRGTSQYIDGANEIYDISYVGSAKERDRTAQWEGKEEGRGELAVGNSERGLDGGERCRKGERWGAPRVAGRDAPRGSNVMCLGPSPEGAGSVLNAHEAPSE